MSDGDIFFIAPAGTGGTTYISGQATASPQTASPGRPGSASAGTPTSAKVTQ